MVKNAMLRAALVAMMAIVPALSFAQSSSTHNGPVTRAQVLQELIDLESVGYRPASANDATYPEDVQSAMRRLAEKRANEARLAQEQIAQSGYGAPPAPNAEASAPAAVSGSEPPPGHCHTDRHADCQH
ncbi:hypothetical protein FHX59_003361 [Paraburkholderia silvatlantica]|uniref:DUF4148 domain-containing protein n=2 Tax=Paraburkholderia silvatlantica TaxID=321895 RepID=A0ABR6FNC9_9BURK|nr:DUF4148 domain-containing protein [Paraburkholderia silvatlantica]MBB2928930.1 hypothetical protein [Paraburkholderia silvatlantica]